MSMYAIRNKDTKEHVGFVWGETRLAVFWRADEETDPYSLEYKRIEEGGIFMDLEHGVEVTFTERLMLMLDDKQGKGWKPLDRQHTPFATGGAFERALAEGQGQSQ